MEKNGDFLKSRLSLKEVPFILPAVKFFLKKEKKGVKKPPED